MSVSDGATNMTAAPVNPMVASVGLVGAFFGDCTGDFNSKDYTFFSGPVGSLSLTLVSGGNPATYNLSSDAVLDLGLLGGKSLKAVLTSPDDATRTYSDLGGRQTVAYVLPGIHGYFLLDGVRNNDFLGSLTASISGNATSGYSQSWQATLSAVPVPEPAGVAMLLGCLTIGYIARRRRG